MGSYKHYDIGLAHVVIDFIIGHCLGIGECSWIVAQLIGQFGAPIVSVNSRGH
jgi:hypothetical protein